MALDGNKIVQNILQPQGLPHTTEDSIFLSPHGEYEELQVRGNERLSCYEQIIVHLKSELEEIKGKEDEYKLQIRQLIKERNEWKRKAEVGCPESRKPLKSSISFPTKHFIEITTKRTH